MKNQLVRLLILIFSLIPTTFIVQQQEQALAAVSMRAVLSASGQSAYDAASNGNFFEVSAADYSAAFTNLNSVSKIGATDTSMATCGGGWSSNYAFVQGSSTSAVNAGSFIVGFQVAMNNAYPGNNARLIYSDTTNISGSFSVYGNSISATNSGSTYYLAKSPSALPRNGFVGHYISTGTQCGVPGSAGSQYSGGAGTTWSSWTPYSSSSPSFQALVSSADVWTVVLSSNPITLSSANTGSFRTAMSINATLGGADSKVTFKANGKKIPGCINVSSTSKAASCTYRPSTKGRVTITATSIAVSGYLAGSSNSLNLTIGPRIGFR